MENAKAFTDEIADAAAEWLTQMMSGEFGETDRQQWQRWREADPEHERAWRHIEAVGARLRDLQGGPAYRSLSALETPSPQRRRTLAALLWLGAGGSAAWATAHTPAAQRLAADYASGVGERRELQLDDGTQLVLDTASAVDVRYERGRRVLKLVSGAVMVRTGHGTDASPDLRPLFVETAEGRIHALGTRFSVRQLERRTRVAVLEHAVEIELRDRPDLAQRVEAGEFLHFTRGHFDAGRALAEPAEAWARGLLIADEQRLDDFLAELSRYRHGVLRCDPAVAGLRFSGVFPLQNPERVLDLLPNSLPVQVRRANRWWVVVEAA